MDAKRAGNIVEAVSHMKRYKVLVEKQKLAQAAEAPARRNQPGCRREYPSQARSRHLRTPTFALLALEKLAWCTSSQINE